MNSSTTAASPRLTHALEDPHAHAHPLSQEPRPRVRYARPDVTETRGTWTEADAPLGYLSAAPDLARLAGSDAAAGPDEDDEGEEEGEEEAWPMDDPPHAYQDPPSPQHRHGSMSVVSRPSKRVKYWGSYQSKLSELGGYHGGQVIS